MTERTRLATTLHEELSQQLATLTVEIDLLSSRPASNAVTDELAHLRRGVVDALESLRSAIFELTPPEPDWTRLEDGLARFVRDHAALRGLDVDYLVKGEARPTDPEVVSLVFATVQEAISNVAKHAETSDVRVRVEFTADHLMVAISDRGVGLADDPDRTDRTHQGLGVVRTRARLAGAKLEVESEAGTGTTVRLTVPVSRAEEVLS